MDHTKPAVFDCVYYFDAGCEDFVLAGVFTRLEDAELCKQTIEADSRLRPVGLTHRTLAALQKEFLDGAIADVRRIILHAGGLRVAVSATPNERGEFECWAQDFHVGSATPGAFLRDQSSGVYLQSDIADAWLGWRAARRSAPVTPNV